MSDPLVFVISFCFAIVAASIKTFSASSKSAICFFSASSSSFESCSCFSELTMSNWSCLVSLLFALCFCFTGFVAVLSSVLSEVVSCVSLISFSSEILLSFIILLFGPPGLGGISPGTEVVLMLACSTVFTDAELRPP